MAQAGHEEVVGFGGGSGRPPRSRMGRALASVLSQAGDLIESGLKRRYGVKDSGKIIPGHGGVMDRLDGFFAVAVLAAVYLALRGGGLIP